MTQLETDLNYISSLADQPAMTTAALKQEFDKAGNVIKDFINQTLEPEITSNIASCLASAKAYSDAAIGALSFEADSITYDNASSGLEADNVQDAIDELDASVESISETASSKLAYGDFAITEHTVTYTNYGGLYDVQSTLNVTNAGYMPLAIAGHSNSAIKNTYSVNWDYLSSRSSGTGTITYKYRYDYQGGGTQSFTAKWYVLWAKIS